MGVAASPPAKDQVEVALLGPGHGESALVHLGNGNWIVVDSCVDSGTREPAALSYLSEMGVEPAEAVRLVIATHWHDDHIRGMARLLEACPNAGFCLSAALGKEEFIAMASAYDEPHSSECSSGVREIRNVMRLLEGRPCPSRMAAPDRPVYRLDPSDSGHGHQCEVTTLSPSDAQLKKFYAEIAILMPQVKRTMQRCTSQAPNHVAVAVWMEIGPLAILLGSDLEETTDPYTGWSVIVNSTTRPPGRAAVFKVAHHGSQTAHNNEVWSDMLVGSPLAVLTPFRRSQLPRPRDVARITDLTTQAYSTARVRAPKVPRADPAVRKTLREMGVTVTKAEPKIGTLRLRTGGIANFDTWTIELIREACLLSNAH